MCIIAILRYLLLQNCSTVKPKAIHLATHTLLIMRSSTNRLVVGFMMLVVDMGPENVDEEHVFKYLAKQVCHDVNKVGQMCFLDALATSA